MGGSVQRVDKIVWVARCDVAERLNPKENAEEEASLNSLFLRSKTGSMERWRGRWALAVDQEGA